jgi:DNA-binding transcriptional MerR regulator
VRVYPSPPENDLAVWVGRKDKEAEMAKSGAGPVPEQQEVWEEIRIGALARKTGLTVRTLHHYEAVGILLPTRRTPAGHRLYGPAQIQELYRVLSLRALGLSLQAIRHCLHGGGSSLEATLRVQLKGVKDQLALLHALSSRIERMIALLDEGRIVDTDEFLKTMGVMTMIEKYYTPEQLEELKARGEALGEEAIREVETEWPRLIGRVREEMEKGTDPSSPGVQALASRWRELVQAFTGGNPEISSSLKRMYGSEPDMAAQQGLDPEIFQYIGRAVQTLPDAE